MQTHMFCGYGPECKPSSSASDLWSMANVAAERLETEYVLVGVLEQLQESLEAFQVEHNSCLPPIGSPLASISPEGCKLVAELKGSLTDCLRCWIDACRCYFRTFLVSHWCMHMRRSSPRGGTAIPTRSLGRSSGAPP